MAPTSSFCKVVVRALESGKYELRSKIKGGGTVFTRAKRDADKQRLIWHGSRLSKLSRRPPRPPELLTPESLTGVMLQRPPTISKRDGKVLFDQPMVLSELVGCFGTPGVTGRQLLAAGLSERAWEQLKPPGARRKDNIFPCSRVWGMGFSWSSYLAQSTMLLALKGAGFADDELMSLATIAFTWGFVCRHCHRRCSLAVRCRPLDSRRGRTWH